MRVITNWLSTQSMTPTGVMVVMAVDKTNLDSH